MKIVGWLASGLGVIGVFACNAITPLLWVLRSNLRSRARDLVAIPDAGIDAALTLTDQVTDWLDGASIVVADIKVRADVLASVSIVDPAAASDLASAVDAFISGPYAAFRTTYTGLRERALSVKDACQGIGRVISGLEVTGIVEEHLRAVDQRMSEIDETMTTVAGMGAAGLSEPGVATTVSEWAAGTGEGIRAIRESVADAEAWLHEQRDRVDAADRRTARALTLGALVGTALAVFAASLNVLLFQQGRRWSRR